MDQRGPATPRSPLTLGGARTGAQPSFPQAFPGVPGPVCVCPQGTWEAGRLGEVWIGGERGKREPKEIPAVGAPLG